MKPCRRHFSGAIALLGCLVFLLSCHALQAQFEYHYTPRKTYSEYSRDLIVSLRNQLQMELSNLKGVPHEGVVRRIYTERTDFLIRQVKARVFIQDDSLEGFVRSVMEKIAGSNTMGDHPRQVLVLKSAEVNAFCFGKGVFVVTTGLLSRLDNESELAFTLAHEMAHDELDHTRARVLQEAEINLAKNTTAQINKIIGGEITLEDIEAFRKLIYGVSRYSREKEIEADSLGFQFFKNASYQQSQSLALLNLLDSAEFPKRLLNERIFVPFHFSKYPFQEHWLKERLSIYSKKSDNTFIFSNDSIRSHPDIQIRKGALRGYVQKSEHPLNYQSPEFIRSVVEMAEFESVESTFMNRQYDRCLFHALQLLSVYPKNVYLITTISRVLTGLREARDDNMFMNFVPLYTSYYSDQLRLVNNFLHNLTTRELGEVAYHFLNNQSNFNSNEEDHYYLLWKLSNLTYRPEVHEKIRQAYKAKFNKNISVYQSR